MSTYCSRLIYNSFLNIFMEDQQKNNAPEGEEQTPKESFVNPIDKDKIAVNPHSLPYAHTVGGVEIKPIDKGKVKGRAMSAMYDQTNMDLEQIRQQMELLARQAKDIHDRVRISEKIYLAELNFDPRIGQTYYLYQRSNGVYVVSLVSPEEWGNNPPYEYISTMELLADHTWNVLDKNEDLL